MGVFFSFLVNDSNIYFRPWNRKATSLLLFKIKIHKRIANSTVQERIWKAGWRNFRKPSRPQNMYHRELIYDCKYLVDQTVSGLFIDWLILIHSPIILRKWVFASSHGKRNLRNHFQGKNYHRLLIEECMAAVKIYTTYNFHKFIPTLPQFSVTQTFAYSLLFLHFTNKWILRSFYF